MNGGVPQMPESCTAVRSHLGDLLTSDEFAGSERRRDLLQFIVEETLSGRADSLKAYTIGTKALGRRSGFDPQTDPIVRVEVGRLRATLDRYYRSHRESGVVISIPKGRYRAEFDMADRSRTAASDGVTIVDLAPFVAHSPDGEAIASAITESTLTVLNSADVRTSLARTDRRAPFVLAGSVRTSADRLRVVAALTSAGASEPVWTRRVDRSLEGTHEFDVADDVAAHVAWPIADAFGVLTPLISRSNDRPLERYRMSYEVVTVDGHRELGSVLDSTTGYHRIDARMRAAMSDVLFTSWWLDLEPPAGALERAEDLAAAAIALDPTVAEGHLAAAYAHYARGRSRLFALEIEAALERSDNAPHVLVAAGLLRVLAGDLDNGISLVHRAVDLNPDLPGWWHVATCVAAFADGDAESALVEANQVGDAATHLGSFLRLALKAHLGHADTSTDAKALLDFDEQYGDRLEERLERVIGIDAVRHELVDAVRSSGALPMAGVG